LHNPFVRDISDSLCVRTEVWRGADPTHGQNQWECDQGLSLLLGREGDAELGNVFSSKPDPVKAVGDVDFTQVHRPKPWISINDVFQQPLEGPTEAHGFFRG
jgi:hypothetical protein